MITARVCPHTRLVRPPPPGPCSALIRATRDFGRSFAGSGIATLLSNIPFYLQGYRFSGYPGVEDGTKTAKGDADAKAKASSVEMA